MISVRPARAEEAHTIAAVHVAAWQTAYRGLVPDDVLDQLDVAQRASDWVRSLGDPDQQTLVAEQNGTLCGFASFGPSRDDDAHERTGEVYAIYVAPACWRRGVGRRLWETAVTALASAGFREVTLWVFEANPAARRFYESVGCAPDGAVSQTEARGKLLTTIRYRWTPTRHIPESPEEPRPGRAM